jgi:hypothetical protein
LDTKEVWEAASGYFFFFGAAFLAGAGFLAAGFFAFAFAGIFPCGLTVYRQKNLTQAES